MPPAQRLSLPTYLPTVCTCCALCRTTGPTLLLPTSPPANHPSLLSLIRVKCELAATLLWNYRTTDTIHRQEWRAHKAALLCSTWHWQHRQRLPACGPWRCRSAPPPPLCRRRLPARFPRLPARPPRRRSTRAASLLPPLCPRPEGPCPAACDEPQEMHGSADRQAGSWQAIALLSQTAGPWLPRQQAPRTCCTAGATS